jgi:hypothetical protein
MGREAAPQLDNSHRGQRRGTHRGNTEVLADERIEHTLAVAY